MLVNFLLLTFLQMATGLAIVSSLTKVRSFLLLFGASILTGLVANTLIVYLIGLFSLPVSWNSILIGLAISSLCGILVYKKIQLNFQTSWTLFQLPKMYEFVFWGVFAYLFYISAWRTWYLPVTPYDAINGIDLFAKFTIKENTFVSSIFDKSIIANLSTQTFYAPFASFMQITYRLCGFPWGQVWLSVVFLGFIMTAYAKLSERCHPIIVGFSLLLVVIAPEFYAYTFLLQTDFTNAIFFGLAVIWFHEYWVTESKEPFYFSLLWFFAACWSRSETIFFLPFGSLLILWKNYRHKNLKKGIIEGILFTGIPGITTILWNGIFYNLIFPTHPDSASEFFLPDYSVSLVIDIINEMNDVVIFSFDYWGYAMPLFLALFVINYFKFKDRQSLIIVAWVVILYFVFMMMKMHMIHVDISKTFRRGYFKFLVLYSIYFTCCHLATSFSKRIWDWEKK